MDANIKKKKGTELGTWSDLARIVLVAIIWKLGGLFIATVAIALLWGVPVLIKKYRG